MALSAQIDRVGSANQEGLGPPDPPHGLPLFVAVNAGCNLRCFYCTENGENRFAGGGRLSVSRLQQVLAAAYASGVRTFRFTGGEPTLRRSLGAILLTARELGPDVRIAITTNGARLEQLRPVLAELEDADVFLSVDGYAEGEPPPSHGEGLTIEKWLTPRLRDVIRSLRGLARLRLNYVLTSTNADQLPALIEYALRERIDLKIFELLLRDFHYAGDRPRVDVFREQYVPVRLLLPQLRRRFGDPRPFAGTGGRGIPMQAFEGGGGSRIIYFDSLMGSHYGEACSDCPLFPCQEGLYGLMLDANGTLHPAGCTHRRLRAHLALARPEQLLAEFRRVRGAIDAAALQRVTPEALNPTTMLT